jgi:hypothetical protein
MPAGKARGLIVVCGQVGAAPKPSRHGGLLGGHAIPVPVTWIVTAERIRAATETIGSARGSHEFALQIPQAAFASRHRLRTLLAMGREALPTLTAIAVRGGEPIEHRAMLVDEGVQVVLVDSLSSDSRGSRRPAPTGWRCRNSSWGLWEIELSPATRRGPLSLFGIGSRPHVPRGGLAVVAADGQDSQGLVHHRLERLATWADRLSTRGTAEVVSLSSLLARLSGDDQQAAAGSVLRAA